MLGKINELPALNKALQFSKNSSADNSLDFLNMHSSALDTISLGNEALLMQSGLRYSPGLTDISGELGYQTHGMARFYPADPT